MFRALTISSGNGTPLLILKPDIYTAKMRTMRTPNNKCASMVSAQRSEIQIEQDQGSSLIESTGTYEVLKRKTAVGSQVSENNINAMKVVMLPTSAQVSLEMFQPETKSLSTEALPNLKTVITGKMLCLSI